jgi:DNA-binding HxlR family transcriptional regulator
MSTVKTKNGEARIERYLSAEDNDPFQVILYLLSQRWTPQIIHHLLKRKLRFNELLRSIGSNPCTLRERLKELESVGIVDRNVVSEMPPCVEYSLT